LIKQQFLLNGEEILRIYHNGFEDYPRDRKVKQINENNIIFEEYWVDSLESEPIPYDNISKGFLPSSHEKNPYSTFCCDFEEYITYEKQFLENNRIKHPALFEIICLFVKKWSGYNLKQSPYSLNNVIVFNPIKIDVDKKLCKENERHIHLSVSEHVYGKLTCIAKFKQNELIVDSKILTIDNSSVIETDKDWNSIDVELFSSNQLIYADYNISFVKSIQLDLSITSKKIDIELQNTQKTITLEQLTRNPVSIGKEINPNKLTTYRYQEKLLKRRLNANKLFKFLSKGQYEEGINIFSDIASLRGFDEMWIFDPYFISYESSGGKARLNDIIKVLGQNLNLKKKIVFEIQEVDTDSSFHDFLESIQGTVDSLKKRGISLDFTFLGTKEHFHDRFIFLKGESRLKAFLLGTSFNSFGDNYSTIIELDSSDGEMIFQTLMNDIANPTAIIINGNLK
jgi:hypothetical protein